MTSYRINNNVKKRLKIKDGYTIVEKKKIIKFLENYPFPLHNANQIDRSEVIQKVSTRMAIALYAKKTRKGIPDFHLSIDDIKKYTLNQYIALQKHTEAMLEIMADINFPSDMPYANRKVGDLVNGERELFESPIYLMLKKFSGDLAKQEKPRKKAKNRRGLKPLRLEIIQSLTDAWIDITGKPPEKRMIQPETGKAYGPFYDFMEKGLELFKYGIHTEEAVKDANKYYLQIITDNTISSYLCAKKSEKRKILTYKILCKLVSSKIKEADGRVPNKAEQDVIRTAWESWENFINSTYGGTSD